MQRCAWAKDGDVLMCQYHDEEWGAPVHDDNALFAFLCLEGAQAGLSWRTVLSKREHYYQRFHGLQINRVAAMPDDELESLLQSPEIIRNRRKIYAMRNNARAVQEIIAQCGNLDNYLWSFVDGQPIINHWQHANTVPAKTKQSTHMSHALKKRGLHFVGPTICYALMQATGMVNDHLTSCFRHPIQSKADH